MRTRVEFDIEPRDLELLAERCEAERLGSAHGAPGELGMFLSRLEGAQRTAHDQDSSLARGCYWRLDLPTLGTTVFGETPEAAMRAAIAAVVKDAEEDEAANEEGESP